MGVTLSTPHDNTFGTQGYHQNNFSIETDCNSVYLTYLLEAEIWRPHPRWEVGVVIAIAYTPTLSTHGYYQIIFPSNPRQFVIILPPRNHLKVVQKGGVALLLGGYTHDFRFYTKRYLG